MMRIAESLEGNRDLAKRLFGYCEIAAPLGENHERDTLMTGTIGPVERHERR
jgi:hypothetical protein